VTSIDNSQIKLSARVNGCLVLGNGAPPFTPVSPVDICITFNGRKPPSVVRWHLDVVSRRVRDTIGSVIEISGKGPGDFTDRLSEKVHRIAIAYKGALGCWPSTGFSILHALWDIDIDIAVRVHGIVLDPSLRRDGITNNRTATPQMYHNWLGERRLSFARWLSAPPKNWFWPMMRPLDMPLQLQSVGVSAAELLNMLSAATRSKMPKDLAHVRDVILAADPGYISCNDYNVQELEHCFHLARGVQETPNWWLFDESAAAVIESLANRIRTGQSALYSSSLKERPAHSV
jgi:hypothetical protein